MHVHASSRHVPRVRSGVIQTASRSADIKQFECNSCCAQVPTNTSLLVTLSPATGQANASFAQLTAIIFTIGNGTAPAPSVGAVSFSRDGASFGSARLTLVNSSSTPGTYAGKLPAELAFPLCDNVHLNPKLCHGMV